MNASRQPGNMVAVDAVQIVLEALAAGAAAGVKDTAGAAVKDSEARRLLDLVAPKFAVEVHDSTGVQVGDHNTMHVNGPA